MLVVPHYILTLTETDNLRKYLIIQTEMELINLAGCVFVPFYSSSPFIPFIYTLFLSALNTHFGLSHKWATDSYISLKSSVVHPLVLALFYLSEILNPPHQRLSYFVLPNGCGALLAFCWGASIKCHLAGDGEKGRDKLVGSFTYVTVCQWMFTDSVQFSDFDSSDR